MSTIFLMAVAVFIVVAFVFRRPYYSFAVYYAFLFLRDRLYQGIQVRYQVAIQLIVMAILFLISILGYKSQEEQLPKPKIQIFDHATYLILFVCFVETINGVLHQYRFFQILVDIYKVVEIIILYQFISTTIRKTEHFEKCMNVLIIEMCIMGFIEMFVTYRGGIGFNIAMSMFPLILAVGTYINLPRYWFLILMVAVIAFTSKTRTYVFGMLSAVAVVCIISKGKRKPNTIIGGIALISLLVIGTSIYLAYTNNEYISKVLNNYVLLRQGFDSAGGYRVYEIRLALQKFADSPIFGKGYGYMEKVYIELMGHFEWGDFMHNFYVEILAKSGLFGAICYGTGIIRYFYIQYQCYCEVFEINEKTCGFLVGGIAGTVCWMVTYFAAPLSSYGYIFIPGILGLLYYQLVKDEYTNEKTTVLEIISMKSKYIR